MDFAAALGSRAVRYESFWNYGNIFRFSLLDFNKFAMLAASFGGVFRAAHI